MLKKYTIGEFAKKTGITIRTLHYYDEIGLLKPAVIAPSGRRYYCDENIIELQKIVSLKFLGYSLEQINDFIHQQEWDLKESLAFQKEEMERKKEHLESVIRALDHALLVMEDQGKVNSAVFITLINNIQREQEHKEWLKEYIPQDTVEKIYNISEEKQQELNKKSAIIFAQLKQAFGEEPSDEHVQNLIQEYIDLAEELYEDIIPLVQHLIEKEIEIEDDPELFYSPFTKEEEEWVSKALEIYLDKIGVRSNGNE